MLKNERVLLKILIGLVAVLIVSILGFAFVYLFSHANASTTVVTSPTPTVAITTTPQAGTRACATGTIQSIDTQGQSFVVAKGRGNKTVTITVDSTTTYHKKGVKAMSFSNLAVGDRVRVIGQGVCTNQTQTFVAQTITVVPAANTTPAITPTPGA